MCRKTMLWLRVLALNLLLFTYQVVASNSDCAIPNPGTRIKIMETIPISIALFEMTQDDPTDDSQWKISVISPIKQRSYFDKYFAVEKYEKGWRVVLLKTIDVEQIYSDIKFVLPGQFITLSMRCKGGKLTSTWVTHERVITVLPVNEFPPVFVQGRITLTVNENANEQYFNVNTTGQLVVQKQADYDRGNKYFCMNIIVKQTNELRSTAVLHIKIKNVNDNAPVFFYLGCEQACQERHYVSYVPSCEESILSEYVFGPINAIDLDNEPVMYRIVHASPPNASEGVELDAKTGEIYIVNSLSLYNTALIGYIIEAYDTGVLQMYDGSQGVNSQFTTLLLIPSILNC